MGRTKVRREIRAFAEIMEKRLKANDHKGGWQDCTNDYLCKKIHEECRDLIYALMTGDGNVPDGAADLANVAMMIADNYQRPRQQG